MSQNIQEAYIRHLFKAEEFLGMRLVTYQNLAYLKHLMQEIRQAIQREIDF
jgi:queuine tRNA-ribosyltransferase